jgi:hypothetical protein
MAYYLCICCDLCNQEGFIKTLAEERRNSKERQKSGRRHSDGRESLRINPSSLFELNNTLSFLNALKRHMESNNWTSNEKFHFCEDCYNKHRREIDDLSEDQFHLAVEIIHNYLS